MALLLTLAVAAVVLAVAAERPGQAATAVPLAVSGSALTAGGLPILLHGVNRSGTEYACIQGWGIFDGPSDDASVSAIAAWNANVVRVPLNEDCWLGINGVPAQYGGANYRQAVTAYVNLLHAHGLYAELSLMWAAPSTSQATYQPAAPDADHSPAMWASMAATFSGDAAVILAPWGETTVSWGCFRDGCANEATFNGAPYQSAGMQQAVTTIRQNGFTGPIAIPCIDYANDCADGSGSWQQYEPADPRHALVVEAHIYGNNACGAQNNGSCLTQTIAPLTSLAPVIFAETGETYDDSECSSSNMQVILPWADAHSVGWEAWTWDTWGSCLSLVSDYGGTCNSSTPAGAQYACYVRNHLLGYSPTPSPAPSPSPSPRPPAAGTPYVLDGYGGVHPSGGAPALGISAYWPGWDVARALAVFPSGGGGYVLDAYGGVHPFGSAPAVPISAYWPGWDIARGIALAPWSSPGSAQGWVLDGYGGLHPFGGAPAVQPGAYWPGRDIAHGLVIGPSSTPSAVWGYTLDAYGGLHPFGGAAAVTNAPYWAGWDIARGVQLLATSTPSAPAGYTVDGFGGVHCFGSAPAEPISAYWPGWDIARGLALATGPTPGGWVLDGYGGLHQFGSAPAIGLSAYWPGWDIAHAAAASGEGSSFNT